MSSVITTIKIISFLFPFLKELFIGKDNGTSKNGKIKPANHFLRKVVIIIGCLSVALNFYLLGKAFNLGRENIQLQKQIKDHVPKPTVYPDTEQMIDPTPYSHEPIKDNHHPKKKALRMPSALPPERESYLKELEAIDQIQ